MNSTTDFKKSLENILEEPIELTQKEKNIIDRIPILEQKLDNIEKILYGITDQLATIKREMKSIKR